MISWITVGVLALFTAGWVLAPLLRADAAVAERVAAKVSEAEELQSQREMALAALKDLEDDRATGKIGEADYVDLKTRLSARAVEILQRMEALDGPRSSTQD
jgi:cell division protein FtsB